MGLPFYFEENVAGRFMKLNRVVFEWIESETHAYRMTSENMLKTYEERWLLEATPLGATVQKRKERLNA